MRISFTQKTHAIMAGHAVSGIAEQAQTIRVACGRVWITIEGMLHDHWLSAGESLVVAPGRLVVIEADNVDSRVDLRDPGGKRRQSGLPTALRFVAPWLPGKEANCC